jgi:divalent metal cation (Fe/Co/Zn/Cd) transporter
LAVITVLYNTVEGLVSVYFGLQNETLSLFGFGIDSFVEVISGIGIWHMLIRINRQGEENRDKFEQTALRITGFSFYILFIGLILTSVYNIIINHKPETTYWGIVISLISICSMGLLIHYKKKAGIALKSKALIADANCTRTCLYLSIVLLFSSLGYLLTHIGGIDSAGAFLIAYFSLKEGNEAFEKAKTGKDCSCEDDRSKN